jgi:hypothetical protein
MLMLYQLVNDLFAIKLSSDCLHCPNVHKLWEHIPKFVVLSIILARPGTILSVETEIIRFKKIWKRINLESDRECPKGLLYHTMDVFGKLHVKDPIQQFLTTTL